MTTISRDTTKGISWAAAAAVLACALAACQPAAGTSNASTESTPKPKPRPTVSGKVTSATSGDCPTDPSKKCEVVYLFVKDSAGKLHKVKVTPAVADRCKRYPGCLDGGPK